MAKMLRWSGPWGTGCDCGRCCRKNKPHMKIQPRQRRVGRAREKRSWKRGVHDAAL